MESQVAPAKGGSGAILATEELGSFVEKGVADGLWSALEGVVMRRGELLFRSASGVGPGPCELSAGGLFDLASLTKPVVASVALMIADRGELPLDEAIARLGTGARDSRGAMGPLGTSSLADLLRHRARLAAWRPLYEVCRSPPEAVERVLRGEWMDDRVGTYSDLGYIAAGALLEQAAGQSLADLVRGLVSVPLGLDSLRYAPLEGDTAALAVPCGLGTGQEVRLADGLGIRIDDLGPPRPGSVQDGNARFLGPSGHAGLFGSAEDVARLVEAWAHRNVLPSSQVDAALEHDAGPRFLGWERQRSDNSAGPALGADAFGHTGFVGGSAWHDPRTELTLVLLGHRQRTDSDLGEARRRYHQLAVEHFGS